MILISGPASTDLAERISQKTGLRLMKIEHKLFPDGESYIRFPERVDGEDLLVVQGTHPPQDRHIVQAYLIAENAVDLGAKSISLISPYLAYARQDKRFLEGEAMSIKSVLRMFKFAGYEKIYTVNIHSPWIAESSPLPLINLHAEEALASYLKNKLNVENLLIVSMGKKGEEMASTVARELNAEYAVAKSSRDRVTGRVVIELELTKRAGDIVVVDDIISTGGTMTEVIKALRRTGANDVYAACVHALMVGNAADKIFNAGAKQIIASDTIPNRYARYSVAEIIAREIVRGK